MEILSHDGLVFHPPLDRPIGKTNKTKMLKAESIFVVKGETTRKGKG
jgi:hypothetical protein